MTENIFNINADDLEKELKCFKDNPEGYFEIVNENNILSVIEGLIRVKHFEQRVHHELGVFYYSKNNAVYLLNGSIESINFQKIIKTHGLPDVYIHTHPWSPAAYLPTCFDFGLPKSIASFIISSDLDNYHVTKFYQNFYPLKTNHALQISSPLKNDDSYDKAILFFLDELGTWFLQNRMDVEKFLEKPIRLSASDKTFVDVIPLKFFKKIEKKKQNEVFKLDFNLYKAALKAL